MSNQIITSELFAELPLKQQDTPAGNSNFELAGSNYTNKSAALQKAINTHPSIVDNSISTIAAVNTTVEALLRCG